jgi:hypothetical protein
MAEPSGPPMYKSLKKTIETFLGKDFYAKLADYAIKQHK